MLEPHYLVTKHWTAHQNRSVWCTGWNVESVQHDISEPSENAKKFYVPQNWKLNLARNSLTVTLCGSSVVVNDNNNNEEEEEEEEDEKEEKEKNFSQHKLMCSLIMV